MIGVNIGLIPCLQSGHILDGDMLGANGQGSEHTRSMVGKTATDQLIKTWLVGKAPAGAMNGQEAVTFFHKLKQVGPLIRGDFSMIGVEQKRIKSIEVIRISQCLLNGGDIVKIDGLTTQCLGEHGIVVIGGMMGGLMAKKQYSHGPFLGRKSRMEGCRQPECRQKGGKEQKGFHRHGLVVV